MPVQMSFLILLVTFLLINTISAYIPYGDASSKSPYESGYDHGCDDSEISDPDDRYINQPEKGPSFHTNEFMRGYNDGYDDCSNGGSSTSNNNNSNDKLRIIVTFIEGQDRNVGDARVYVKEYPQYGIPGGAGSDFIDLNDAFYNDDPYTGVWEDEITIPPDLIDVGEEFHVCIEDTRKDITVACYELENGPESEPEHLEIDFDSFP